MISGTKSDGFGGAYQYFEEANPGVLRVARTGKRILDVGCGYGTLGERLRNNGNYVVGVDIEESAIKKAQERLDETFVLDITAVDAVPREWHSAFEEIVFADILEHLPDPAAVLRRFRPCLKQGGRIVVSVPNVASWPIRLKLLIGRFDYSDTGILDRSHVRFFTKRTACALIRDAGFQIKRITVTPNFTRAFLGMIRRLYLGSEDIPSDPGAIARSRLYRYYIRWIYPVETLVARLRTGLFAFQFIIEATVTNEGDGLPSDCGEVNGP